ncbi:hypothetical protein DET57_1305 [Klebsiella oxytoca]|uniref:Uncharacterized protein n=1 Tax=Klebsiella oxytoca TaxID=571 RepID=A0A318F9R3_KLEOX|nr:hypothetical protein DET57_1305 [Klebsiella oxytoca]
MRGSPDRRNAPPPGTSSIIPEAVLRTCPGYTTKTRIAPGFLLPSLLRRLGHRLFEGIHRTEAVIINRTPVQRQRHPLRR